MGRLSSVFARSKGPAPAPPTDAHAEAARGSELQAPPSEAPRPAPLPRAASPGRLRRERRALLRAREERIRDLGGLMLEMYKRDEFRETLIVERCTELLRIEARLEEVDSLLAASSGARRPGPESRCACGAPIIFGSHFCGNCGRPVGGTPVLACARCGSPLAADARFCSTCGAAGADAFAGQAAGRADASDSRSPTAGRAKR